MESSRLKGLTLKILVSASIIKSGTESSTWPLVSELILISTFFFGGVRDPHLSMGGTEVSVLFVLCSVRSRFISSSAWSTMISLTH